MSCVRARRIDREVEGGRVVRGSVDNRQDGDVLVAEVRARVLVRIRDLNHDGHLGGRVGEEKEGGERGRDPDMAIGEVARNGVVD